MVYAFLVVLGCSCLYSVSGQNSACNQLNQKDGPGWTCKKITECTAASQLLKEKKAVYCGYENQIRKLCCKSVSVTSRPPVGNITSKPPQVTRPPSVQDPVTIAREKCVKYAAYRITNVTEPAPVLGGKPIIKEILDCKNIDSLIVNGEKVEEKEMPHMVLLGYRDVPVKQIDWLCGGSLISEQYVLTAGHCTNSAVGPVRWVGIGVITRKALWSAELNKNIFKVADFINYPDYKPPRSDNDIALVKLEAPIKLTSRMRPICLFTTADVPTILQNKVSVAGWGQTKSDEAESEYLLKATINLLPETRCTAAFAQSNLQYGFNPASMVCAGDMYKGKDTCTGDSGGPLQVPISDYNCMWSQMGITSIGKNFCGDKETPAVYTKVSYYLPWIQKIVWPQ